MNLSSYTLKSSLLILFCLFSLQANFAQSKKQKKEAEQFTELINNIKLKKHFEFNAQWSSGINLIDNPNYLIFDWASVDLSFPFFGEVQNMNGYNRDDVGITYKGSPEELTTSFDIDKRSFSIRFKEKNNNKNRTYYLTLFANGKANLSVVSNDRASASYRGTYKFKSE